MSLKDIQDKKKFYEEHINFSQRSLIDYRISPGTKAKFNIIKKQLGSRKFHTAIDIGCSGNSILPFLDNISRKLFVDIALTPLKQYSSYNNSFPVVSVFEALGIKEKSFDLVTALDVLEHVANHQAAIAEINRIIKPGGIILITVPHRMKFYSYQDTLIGHYRRYELEELHNLFKPLGIFPVKVFGIYGQAMRVQMIQASKPEMTEEKILDLRRKYNTNPLFCKIWDKIVDFGKFWMTLDAKYQPVSQIMNIGVIYRKSKKNPKKI